MKSESIFIIPNDILVEIFSNWVPTPDLVKLDSAVAHNQDRKILLEIIQDKNFVTSGFLTLVSESNCQGGEFLKWLIVRGVQVRTVDFRKTYPKDTLSLQSSFFFKNITVMNASYKNANATRSSSAVLHNCSNILTELSFYDSKITENEVMKMREVFFPKLMVLNVTDVKLQGIIFAKFLDSVPHVAEIIMDGSNLLQESVILSIDHYLKNLQNLSMRNMDSMSLETLYLLVHRLKKLDLSGSTFDKPDNIMKCLPHILNLADSISLQNCAQITQYVLLTVLKAFTQNNVLKIKTTLNITGCHIELNDELKHEIKENPWIEIKGL
jgi:hypothetical protein